MCLYLKGVCVYAIAIAFVFFLIKFLKSLCTKSDLIAYLSSVVEVKKEFGIEFYVDLL